MSPSEFLILSKFVHAQLLHLCSPLNVGAVSCLPLQDGRARVVHEAARRVLGDERRERVAGAAAGMAAAMPTYAEIDYEAMLPAVPVPLGVAAPEAIAPAGGGGPAAMNTEAVATYLLSNLAKQSEGDAASKLWNNVRLLTGPATRLTLFQTSRLVGSNPKDMVIVECIRGIFRGNPSTRLWLSTAALNALSSAQLIQVLQLRFSANLGITVLLNPVPSDADVTVLHALNAAKAAIEIVSVYNAGLAGLLRGNLLPRLEATLEEHTPAMGVLDAFNALFSAIGAFGGTLDIIDGVNPLRDAAYNTQFLLGLKLSALSPVNVFIIDLEVKIRLQQKEDQAALLRAHKDALAELAEAKVKLAAKEKPRATQTLFAASRNSYGAQGNKSPYQWSANSSAYSGGGGGGGSSSYLSNGGSGHSSVSAHVDHSDMKNICAKFALDKQCSGNCTSRSGSRLGHKKEMERLSNEDQRKVRAHARRYFSV